MTRTRSFTLLLVVATALSTVLVHSSDAKVRRPVVYAKKSGKVAPNTHGTVIATCPLGTLAAGGGWKTSAKDLNVVASGPYDTGSDRPGWQIAAYNHGHKKRKITAFVSCVRNEHEVDVRFSESIVSLPAGERTTVQDTCGAGEFSTAGMFANLGGDPSMLSVASSTRLASAWEFQLINSGPTSMSVAVAAVCFDEVVHGASGSTTLTEPGRTSRAAVDCLVLRQQVLSGGAEVAGTTKDTPATDVVLRSSYPSKLKGGNRRWVNVVSTPTTSETVDPVVSCWAPVPAV